MSEARKASVPFDPNVVPYPVLENDKKAENVPYREAVGSLMFLAVVSRTDIAFAVNTVSTFLNNHNDEHWRAVKRIIMYIRSGPNKSLNLNHRQLNYSKTVKWDYIFGDALKWRCPNVRPN
jgi:hypothetical protein